MEKINELREVSAAVALATLGTMTLTPQQQMAPVHPAHQQQEQEQISNYYTSNNTHANSTANTYRMIEQPFLPATTRTITLKKKPGKKNFAEKLFDLLNSGIHSDIVSWLPGGKAFIVMNKTRFAREILPTYFKGSQYTSFTRKLSRWKFTRVSRGPYMGAYYHKNFRADSRMLCKLMSCCSNNGDKISIMKDQTSSSKIDDEEEETRNSVLDRRDNETEKSGASVVADKVAEEAVAIARSIEEQKVKVIKKQQELLLATSTSRPPAQSFLTPQVASFPRFATPAITMHLDSDVLAAHPQQQEEQEDVFLPPSMMLLKNNIKETSTQIQFIKDQLMEIQLHRARVEKMKKLLKIKAELEDLCKLRKLKNAVKMSFHQHRNESQIIAAATRALNRSNNIDQYGLGLDSINDSRQQRDRRQQNLAFE